MGRKSTQRDHEQAAAEVRALDDQGQRDALMFLVGAVPEAVLAATKHARWMKENWGKAVAKHGAN